MWKPQKGLCMHSPDQGLQFFGWGFNFVVVQAHRTKPQFPMGVKLVMTIQVLAFQLLVMLSLLQPSVGSSQPNYWQVSFSSIWAAQAVITYMSACCLLPRVLILRAHISLWQGVPAEKIQVSTGGGADPSVEGGGKSYLYLSSGGYTTIAPFPAPPIVVLLTHTTEVRLLSRSREELVLTGDLKRHFFPSLGCCCLLALKFLWGGWAGGGLASQSKFILVLPFYLLLAQSPILCTLLELVLGFKQCKCLWPLQQCVWLPWALVALCFLNEAHLCPGLSALC